MKAAIWKALVIAALLAAGLARAEGAIQVANEYGRTVAQFQIGDSHCVLKDDQIRCTPAKR